MRIVLPLDLSDTAATARDTAVQIAKGLGDHLVLVTVADQRLMSELREMAEAEHADTLELIETYLRGFSSELEGVTHDYAVVPGDDAAEALIDFARDDETRMIVMATHGRSGLARWRLGSVAERVVRHAEVPVVVVPSRDS